MERQLDYATTQSDRTMEARENVFGNSPSLERDLNDIISALALLGVVRCSQCKQFYRASEPGVLFDADKPVCYACVPDWWSSISSEITVQERERLEAKLASWLRKYHRAIVIKETPGKVMETVPADFSLVTKCAECLGSGKLLEGERCRFCNGFGTVRIVVPK